MSSFTDLVGKLHEIGLIVFYLLMILGMIDNFLLIRYKGSLNRGFTIWQRPLNEDEYHFFSNLKENILEERPARFVKKQSFVAVKAGEVLVRYAHPHQSTSWPLVGYANLSRPNRAFEYRLSLPMFVAIFAAASLNLFVFAFLLFIFFIALFMEYVGLRDFLAQKVERYKAGFSPFKQK